MASSQAVWLLWVLVSNVALALWLGERAFNWWLLLGGPQVASLIVAAWNLILLLVWELAARRWRASILVGPRVLAALVISPLVTALVFGPMVTVLVIGDALSRGLVSVNSLAWIAVTLGLGFYFGILADITPPVALAAYAAAGMAGSDPFKTGNTAFRLGITKLIVPFVFVFSPSLLISVQGFTWYDCFVTLFGCMFGLVLLSACLLYTSRCV